MTEQMIATEVMAALQLQICVCSFVGVGAVAVMLFFHLREVRRTIKEACTLMLKLHTNGTSSEPKL
jgi:hypothetical protein